MIKEKKKNIGFYVFYYFLNKKKFSTKPDVTKKEGGVDLYD